MHTYHRIAVVANDRNEAVSIVQDFANEQGWSDWNTIHEDKVDWVLNFKNDTDKFQESITLAIQHRDENISKVITKYGDISLRSVFTDPKFHYGTEKVNTVPKDETERDQYFDDSLAVFRIKRAFNVFSGEYFEASMFFDLEGNTTETKYLNNRINTDPTNQWIVIVDYHF